MRGGKYRLLILGLAALGIGIAAGSFLRSRSPAPAGRAPGGAGVPNFSLLDLGGKYFELYRQKQYRAVVIVTHGIGCPILEKELPLLEELRRRYGERGVGFFLLNGNEQDTRSALRAAVKEQGITAPILLDERQSVVTALGFTRTAEALVVETEGWHEIYRGAVDDRLSYGTDRKAASHHWLENALDAFLAGRAVETPRTNPDGCLLRRVTAAAVPTYNGAVAGILLRRCLPCHSAAGRVPPTNLGTYEDARGWAPMIEETVLTKRMSPWSLDPEFGKFEDVYSLRPAEERDLLAWIRNGTPRGDGQPRAPDAPSLRFHPDVRIVRQGEPVPPSTTSRWIYTPVMENAPRDYWIQALGVNTGKPRVHVSVYVLKSLPSDLKQTEHGLMNVLDHAEFRQNLAISGMGFTVYPAGTVMHVPKGSALLLEQHLYPSSQPDENRLTFAFEEYKGRGRPKELIYEIVQPLDFAIPPGERDFPVRRIWTAPRNTWVVSVLSHMHMHGTAMKATLTRLGHPSETLFSLTNYSYTHNRTYTFEKPVFVPKGSEIEVTAFYDTSPTNPNHVPTDAPLRFGPDLEKNEMADLVMYRYE